MPPKKELSKHQLSHRLQFQSHTPNFLRAFQAQVSGFRTGGPGDDDEDGPSYANDDDFGPEGGQNESGGDVNGTGPAVDEFGREIRRETSAEPKGGSNVRGDNGKGRIRGGDEDEEDEMPQIVVLKEGKHLSAREAENERRRARGLSPVPDLDRDAPEREESPPGSTSQTASKPTLHRARQPQPKPSKSGAQLGAKVGGAKRKVPVGGRDDEQNEDGPVSKKSKGGEGGGPKKEKKEKGKKKAVKGLLSFGDDG